jgi:hypothetical protein
LWTLLAVTPVVATTGALVVGIVLDVDALAFWGVLSAYLGFSWVVPGIMVGIAVTDSKRARGEPPERSDAIAAGIAVGVSLLVVTAAILVAGQVSVDDEPARNVASPTEETVTEPAEAEETVSEPGGDEAVDIVRREASATGVVRTVDCAAAGDGTFCAVTLAGSVCQLWLVQDDEASTVGPPIDGGVVTRTATGVRCDG